jgi:hypothetical protein
MKRFKKQNHTKVALFAGATALMSLTPNIHAQSSVDALLNKLEQKGVLSVDEAKELKAENATNSAADFDAEMNSKFTMPSWITSYKLSGDFRGRFDDQSGDEAGVIARERLRYRLRAGLTLDMKDNLEVGFRLGSGDGGPLSNNQTMSGNGSKKSIYVDTAYGKWTPINDGTWMLAGTFGKMVNPFDESPMVFDPDYTPEGAALQATYKLNSKNSFRFNSAAFVLDEAPKSSHDPFLYGGQIIWDAKWTPAIGTALGIAAYDISGKQNLSANYDSNVGNTLAGGLFATDFNPIVASGNVTYTLDKFPLYTGAFPIKLAGEYMNNPAASGKNIGYWGGVTFGKSGKKGTWDISYRYQVLDANAWWDQIVDDDNIAVLPTSTTAAGIVAGTGIKGHLIKANYSITDALTFSFTCYANTLIIDPVAGTKSDALHMMADIMWKF